jgi:hypothetical protein
LPRTEYFFGLLERETKPISIRLRGQIEQIIESDGSLKEKCDCIQQAIRDAMPAILLSYRN